jgi:hypothetical protein
MNKRVTFQPHSPEKQKEYERQARLQYGADNVNESVRRWASYSPERQQSIMEEGGQVYVALADAMRAGLSGDNPQVRTLLERWYQHIRYFYEPTLDILRGLGDLYNTDAEFKAFFERIDVDLPAYLQEVIGVYVDALETEEIERMLAHDAEERISRLQS